MSSALECAALQRSCPGETIADRHCHSLSHSFKRAPLARSNSALTERHQSAGGVVLRCQAAEEPEQIDVSTIFVDVDFRSTPWAQEEAEQDSSDASAKILFVSESNVCRSVLAEAVMRQLLQDRGLAGLVICDSKGTRDYNAGEGPEAAVLEVAREAGLPLPEDFQARQLQPEVDIVHYDLVCVMDKYTAADVLREVSVFDTINSAGGYSRRVRRLGEFHPRLGKIKSPDGQDIDDPLYGNVGGAAEKEAVAETLGTIQEACEGLVRFLEELQGSSHSSVDSAGGLREKLAAAVRSFENVDWLVPPMLQKAR